MDRGRGKYKTKQRELIISFLKSTIVEHVTAEIIAESLKGKVGQTTVYRNLDGLLKEGKVIKYNAQGGQSACYRYIGDEQDNKDFYHFFCINCGEMQHLNCEHLEELSKHVSDEHGMNLDSKKTVLYGSCRDCTLKHEQRG